MSKTEREGWERLWWDKTTEPYTVLYVKQRYPDSEWLRDHRWYTVYYRSYKKRGYLMVYARDHLDAYIQGLKRVAENKKKADHMYKKEQTK